MSSDDWRRDWLYFANGERLHRVVAITWREDCGLTSGPGETLCGRSGRLSIPGIMSRMGMPRCVRCCKLTGIPRGDGAPFNEDIEYP